MIYKEEDLKVDASKYKKVHHTYLVDPENCVYLSKFGLIDPDGQTTKWKSSCGNNIRYNKANFSNSKPRTDAVVTNIYPFESYQRCLAGWKVHEEMEWLDSACVP